MEYEVEGFWQSGRPTNTWREVVQKDCQARKLNWKNAIDWSRTCRLSVFLFFVNPCKYSMSVAGIRDRSMVLILLVYMTSLWKNIFINRSS